ncbi:MULTISPECIES: glyceraldehyde-3-phosphate dehydrogenase [Acinetobacter]|uniref:Glyceraldehyde-3-phosphate dehydrogenase n=1 Tax=Acinetobacter parvus DSM 16617 = CIP 108168 TaxID=981333 RepID=N8RNU3_9GAMM|nr:MULTISPECIES: glyceraldehyde-3-phosphate dehydrogenase [Acinetobacter]ENU37043.1 glyceraldehyde-3-phosphate dehydrogenase, type I [Acinetobacter parvus DSM 16617 = CIP 108168]ENU84858.1 glyceraldehyde-3-phosphate dehydrogenase, type I [Acinetobacter sp. CIP 102159]ENU90296.1 glyceraldehyde-3-phosphate dehydrogenase, type I [Acinetobacter sp. CIP 102529]MCU4394515.1 glyceraldehyde-3-phosphate dehydrogenase [Acinetobacter parvus]MCU4611476.1 glyceraldehyde-3-phosphate dehydrogenase [Acinetoba
MSKDTIVALHAEHQGRWKNREEIAERMITLIGQLYREKNIVVSVYGRSLINRSVIQILKTHRRTRMVDVELSVVNTFPILEALMKVENIGSAEVDIGKLAVEYQNQGGDVDAFVANAVASIQGNATSEQPKDVVLYGFGRIGRILARLIISQSGLGRGLSLKAIVVRKSSDGDLAKRASLLRRDSIHGTFDGTISVDEENEAIIANGNFIKVIYASSPSQVDYTAYGIENALLIDNTGKWRDAEGLSQHLKCAGIARVVLTAPSKGEMKNVVYGVNNTDILDEDKIISAASCTTNAITPVLKVLDDKYKVLNGHVETVHSFTNDQNLIDNYHKADRRGRAATLNMVITETGAAKAVAKALPGLKGKLTGNSVRVPTPNVSLAILNLNLEKEVDREEVNEYIRQISINSSLQGQIGYTNSTEVVSSDFIGSRTAGVFDAQATITSGTRLTAYVWYDNEVGYSCQVLRIAEQMCGVSYAKIPAQTDA